MKRHIYILFVLVAALMSLYSVQSQEYWLKKPPITTKWLYRVSFPDSLNGWAGGDSGIIVHTSDGGNTWDIQHSDLQYFIEDIFFLNERLGWAISNDYYTFGTIIMKTTNGGTNWQFTRYPDTTLILNTIYYVDSLHGYLGGYDGTILKTTDAGSSWNRCSLDSNFFIHFPFRKFSFLDNQHGVACGGIMDIAGIIYRTSDSGLNWHMVDTTNEPVNGVLYWDSTHIFAAGGDFEYGGSFLFSTNGGNHWTDSTVGIFGAGQNAAVRVLNEIWIPLGFSGRWMLTRDTGKTFKEFPAPDSSAIYDAVFLTDRIGWAVGSNGTICKYNSSLIGVGDPGKIADVYKLEQNYPNPFNPATTITYSLSHSAVVTITLYDAVGREVKTLLRDFKMPGKYNFKFNANDLSSGVYFYKLQAGSYIETKKMVLLK
jgi:photosystem II stability/assembly factor-like uncharacterized protein